MRATALAAAVRSGAVAALAVIAVAVTAADVRAAERPVVVVTSGQEQQFGIALQKFSGGPGSVLLDMINRITCKPCHFPGVGCKNNRCFDFF